MDKPASAHQDSKGRFTHTAVEAVTGVKIPIELLAELRMSAAAMSRAVKKITDVANLSASGAKAVIAHGFMREASGEAPTLDTLAAESAEVFGPAKQAAKRAAPVARSAAAQRAMPMQRSAAMQRSEAPAARRAPAARSAATPRAMPMQRSKKGAGQLIGLAGPEEGAGFDFGAFLRNAGKAAKIAVAAAPAISAAARMAPAAYAQLRRGAGLDIGGAGLDIGGAGGLDVGGRMRSAAVGGAGGLTDTGYAYGDSGAMGSLIASDLQNARLRAGLMLGGQKKSLMQRAALRL